MDETRRSLARTLRSQEARLGALLDVLEPPLLDAGEAALAVDVFLAPEIERSLVLLQCDAPPSTDKEQEEEEEQKEAEERRKENLQSS
jgi:hypothetical protein